ncbi:N-acetyltransferase [Myxococcota bacterium]|nr:N-acetyltransferase [Myxococcota bacterium]MBU1535193.1 N-acetyltransferase [Myxococcota bacterium]
MEIRESNNYDLDVIMGINREAFGEVEEVHIMTRNLLRDSSALPLCSLLAFEGDTPAGYILLTSANIEGESVQCMILAPLAVVPGFQGRGIGSALVHDALHRVRQQGVELVFVLGHPNYYPRFGFISDAHALGFRAPYPILERNAPAWMVCPLAEGVVGKVWGAVRCAQALDYPELWRE